MMMSTSPDCKAGQRWAQLIGTTFSFARVAEHGRGYRLAEIDVHALPVALVVHLGEAEIGAVMAGAVQHAACLDGFERLAAGAAKCTRPRARAEAPHFIIFMFRLHC
ncbi:hypothetical protein [Mesorhizobium sp. M0011]|uniref:hypothetical protein n=1 Tax=Mesorhizobium sp. M0011 TaxID=2956839 RepID=UPI003339EFA8